jgi:glutathione S-transferase
MSEIILHNYPQSPVAEKVRVGLGIKGLAWRSVEIPRIPPKPDLIPLTGGYRRTPVMQIGADIYCDSMCILRELDRRHPSPAFYAPGHAGRAWGFGRWTDDRFFKQTIELVLAGAGDALPADFAEDRGRLYFGPDWQQALTQAQRDLAHTAAQVRGQLYWLDQELASQPFLAGDQPGLADACGYYLVWFIRGRWSGGPDLLAPFANLLRWEQTISDIGHGSSSDMPAAEALSIAAASTSTTTSSIDPLDPQQLQVGMPVAIGPDIDGGEVNVQGTIQYADCHTVAVMRSSEQTGEVCVHFPRVGYRIEPV